MSAKKKVIFCTYSSIYSSKVLEQLVVDTDIELVAIVNSTRVFRPSLNPLQGAIIQLKTSGLRYSTYLFLITDVFKWMQPLLKLRKWPLKNVHALAKSNNIPIFDTRDINSIQITNLIKNKKPDFLLCAHFNQLLKEPVLSIEDMQFINIHPSLLPNYKGVDPVFFAMRDNVKDLGVSLHNMDESFDSGEVLLQTKIKMDETKSLLFNNCQLFEEGIKLALKWMKNDQVYTPIQKVLKDNSNDNYDSWPSSKDVGSFKKSGKRLMRLSGLWNQQ
ncbi:MAG: formyltransferase family protein [Cocleimonas sp.]